ncbi:MAG: carboxypeptidase-like regulatory domain-containing protein, partial [Conexivisphaera sp.]
LHPEVDVKPRVLYVNLPKPYIAGDVLDPEGKEAVVGAEVTAIDLVTGDVRSTATDDLGSFWLEGLEKGHRYLVKVKGGGYGEKTIGVYVAEEDINAGEIRLSSA